MGACAWLVMSDALWPCGLSPTRLFCPWNFPGKNTRMGWHSLSRVSSWSRDGIWVSCIAGRFSLSFLKSLFNVLQYCLCFMFCFFWTGGIWDLSILTRDWTHAPCIGRQQLNHWTTRDVPRQILYHWSLTGFLGTFLGYLTLSHTMGCLCHSIPLHCYPQDTVFHTHQVFVPSLHPHPVPCLVCSPLAFYLASSMFRLHMDSSRKTFWQLRLT